MFGEVLPTEKINELVEEFEFAKPPPARRGPVGTNKYGRFWTEVARQLKENPGRWALVLRDTPTSTLLKIRKGNNRSIDPDLFEVTMRSIKNHPARHVTLYMRYVGENGEFADDA